MIEFVQCSSHNFISNVRSGAVHEHSYIGSDNVFKMLSTNMYNNVDLARKREQQIDTLKVFNENVTEIHFDKEYCVEFPTNAGSLKLIIELNPKFPLEKPRMKVYPRIIHKWVDINGEIVLAPGLTNYTIHSDLGRVVQVIRREFELDQSLIQANESNSFPANVANISIDNACTSLRYRIFRSCEININ